MPSFPAAGYAPASTRIHPALRSFGDECGDALIKTLAYIGALALLAAIALYAAKPLLSFDDGAESGPPLRQSFVPTPRSPPAFVVSQLDFPNMTAVYDVLRHPAGGRKDVLHWTGPTDAVVTELEIYRPGAEASQGVPPLAELAARMDPDGTREVQTAGVIDSKFGAVTLLTLTDPATPQASCLGFVKSFEQPRLRLSGWSCQGQSQPERRAAIGCLVDRLGLLSAGADPALAELFARAELRRVGCGPATAAAATTANWVNAPQNPRLRGSL